MIVGVVDAVVGGCKRVTGISQSFRCLATVVKSVPITKPTLNDRNVEYWERRSSEEMESASRWGELSLPIFDTATMSDDEFLAFKGERRLRSMAFKYNIYSDVFANKVIIPKKNVSAVFGENATIETAFYRGNALEASKMQSQPSLFFTPSDKKYSIALVDTDGRLDGKEGQLANWIVCNATSPQLQGADVVLPYIPPMTPKNTGYHRLVLVLMEQSKDVNLANDVNKSLEGRYISLSSLMAKHSLKPVAFSFSQVCWDESVPKAFKNHFKMEEPQF
eukprot:m.2100 g.2100  ORF g.2100 m.2100 type:complete len:277 (+) comp1718_c0_seq1:62-892(+)